MYTKGPWRFSETPVNPDFYQKEDRMIYAGPENRVERQHIAEVFQYRNDEFNAEDGTALANARLIAAAPELYESLKGILDGFEAGVFVRNIEGDGKSDWAVKLLPFILTLQKAQAAIAKAVS